MTETTATNGKPSASWGQGPTPPPLGSADALQRLRRNRALATGLLCAMVAVYGVTLLASAPSYIVRLIRAMSEAGIVGGLADWFAVTALFRHPLGLPIPHTAVIPASQKRIAATLGRFISTNFLTRELVLRKARELAVGRRLALWLDKPSSKAAISVWVMQLLPRFVAATDSRELRDFLTRAIGTQLQEADLGAAIARVLQLASRTREADALFARLADAAADWIEANRPQILGLVEQRNRWWIPKALNRSIAEAITGGLMELFTKLRQPESEERAKLLSALSQMADEIVSSPQRKAELETFVKRAFDDPEFRAWLHSLWQGMSQAAIREAEHPSSAARALVGRLIDSLVATFIGDSALIARVDAAAERMALVIVARRHEIAGIVDEVVSGWDPQVMSERLETVVGSDLQYIRMNGTLVGALVGGVLYVVSRLIEPAL